jgi:ABC-type molybdenum transport system ATPase subunit/photorepair protein PhrA
MGRNMQQKPDIYEGLKTDDIWLIYGRKGSGKSTIVDYLEKQNHDRKW